MAGQMLMLGFRGTELAGDNPIVADIRDRHLGGVILFSEDLPSGEPTRNVESRDQLTRLCGALRAEAARPLLIAVDQEGGAVSRLRPEHGFPATRSHAELGALDDTTETRRESATVARRLASTGINLNLAPVVDLDTNPANPVIGALGRSFSDAPEVVTRHAQAFIEGHRAYGILTAPKHFPGHGSSEGDTHQGFVDVSATWNEAELEPYRALVSGRLARMVMVAHVFNAALDEVFPASLSHATVTGLLRDEIGFDGVIITDDLQMGAISGRWAFEDAIRHAINAGADIVIYANQLEDFDPGLGQRAHDTIVALVESGDIRRERVEASYRRIMALKAQLPSPPTRHRA
ncbi:MAG: glycoside hydrolase family 3 protein [Dehalococcoidia bacterium]